MNFTLPTSTQRIRVSGLIRRLSTLLAISLLLSACENPSVSVNISNDSINASEEVTLDIQVMPPNWVRGLVEQTTFEYNYTVDTVDEVGAFSNDESRSYCWLVGNADDCEDLEAAQLAFHPTTSTTIKVEVSQAYNYQLFAGDGDGFGNYVGLLLNAANNLFTRTRRYEFDISVNQDITVGDIEFAEPQLKACINVDDDTRVLNVEEVDCSDTEITDISELRFFPNLTHLDLSNTATGNSTPFAYMSNLQWLNVGNSNYSCEQMLQLDQVSGGSVTIEGVDLNCDIYPVTDLLTISQTCNLLFQSNLWSDMFVDLSSDRTIYAHQVKKFSEWCDIDDYQDFAKFINLASLSHRGDDATNITPLLELPLTHLYISSVALDDITGIEQISSLEHLTLRDQSLLDISLNGLEFLETITVSEGSSTTLELENLPSLRQISARGNELDQVSLSNLESLINLYLEANNINDGLFFSNLPNLERVYLSNNQIESAPNLTDLSNLVTIDLRNNLLTDISNIGLPENLATVQLSINQLSDIDALTDIISLKTILASSNEVDSIPDLSNLTQLERLDLDANLLSNLDEINHPTLLHLSLDNNNLTSLPDLSGVSNLSYLNLGFNQIEDISTLPVLASLETLYLQENNLSTGVLRILDLPQLTWLRLDGNPNIPCADLNAISEVISLITSNTECTESP